MYVPKSRPKLGSSTVHALTTDSSPEPNPAVPMVPPLLATTPTLTPLNVHPVIPDLPAQSAILVQDRISPKPNLVQLSQQNREPLLLNLTSLIPSPPISPNVATSPAEDIVSTTEIRFSSTYIDFFPTPLTSAVMVIFATSDQQLQLHLDSQLPKTDIGCVSVHSKAPQTKRTREEVYHDLRGFSEQLQQLFPAQVLEPMPRKRGSPKKTMLQILAPPLRTMITRSISVLSTSFNDKSLNIWNVKGIGSVSSVRR